MKAQTLPEVIRAFDPIQPLMGQELKDWYIDRPGNPLEKMKIYLQGLGLADQPVKLLLTGHMGSGKSTTLNKLAEDLKRRFFIVPFDVRQSAKVNFLAVELQTKFAKEAATRDEIRKRVESRLAELHDKINQVADLVSAKYKRPVLFFIENTDKPDLNRARDIFRGHTYALTAFRASVVYTFPIALRYSAADFGLIRDHFTETFVLPNFKVANSDGMPDPEGLECLNEALSVRMVDGLIQDQTRDTMVQASGGLMRTLIQLTRRAAVNAVAAGSQEISVESAGAAIDEERASFVAGLSRNDYPVLYERHRDKQLSSDEAVLRLLETRALLEYGNGDPWCDVHPIALPLILERTSQR